MFFLSPCSVHQTLYNIRYHNTKMVNYDTQNGFFVSSTLMQPLDEPYELHSANINGKQSSNATITSTNKNAPISKPKKTSNTQTPSISILTINEVRFFHAGNITCAPSNAKQASITVHVLRGNINVHCKAIKHIFIARSLLFFFHPLRFVQFLS